MLAQHLASRLVNVADADALVFISPEGDVIEYAHWHQRVWPPACRAAGIQGG